MKLAQIFLFFILLNFNAQALESLTIPNAKCGNGSPYQVFIDQKEDTKLMIEFMGGGACWDFESCFIVPHTWIFPVPNLTSLSLFTNNDSDLNFLKDHSKIYFPYCTGDIHVGKHIGYYGKTKVYHNGLMNVTLALDYLKANNKIKFNKVKDLVVWGASAGALATMIHSKKIETFTPLATHKTMLIDSPGLHWGKTFWDKFPRESILDFNEAFSGVNVHIDFNDGFVVKDLTPFFKTYSKWKIGFLLGTQDFVMSSVFGEISPYDQEDLILSKKGLPKMSEKFSNAKTWVTSTSMHTFLLLSKSAEMESFDKETAIDFAKRIYHQK